VPDHRTAVHSRATPFRPGVATADSPRFLAIGLGMGLPCSSARGMLWIEAAEDNRGPWPPILCRQADTQLLQAGSFVQARLNNAGSGKGKKESVAGHPSIRRNGPSTGVARPFFTGI